MAGFDTGTGTQLVRANVWDAQLKEVLLDDLMAMKYIDWISGFGDGTTLNIPSVGQTDVDNYLEDTAIKYRAMDTGNFTMTITEYLQAGTYITNKMKQDSFYTDRLVASFVPNQHRALMERVETDILNLAMSQTTSNPNTINGADHRWVGAGTNETMSTADFAKALLALQKARVPMTNLIAIVDPSVEHAFNTVTNLTNMSNNPMWEGIVADGIASGMRFSKNVYGFDVYVSNYLPTANETITSNGTARTTAAGKANLFFSAAGGDLGPFKGAWRQMPKVDTKYNMDMQRDEFATTARYGVKLYREENLVVILTDTDQVG
jgi:hypothetical protein